MLGSGFPSVSMDTCQFRPQVLAWSASLTDMRELESENSEFKAESRASQTKPQ